MTTITTTRAIGRALDRVDGAVKVKGTATYAFEQPVERPAYLYPLQATIAAGRITDIDAAAATADPDVLAVLTHENAPKLAWTDDPEVAVLYSDEVAFRAKTTADNAVKPMRAATIVSDLIGRDLGSVLPPTGLLAGPFTGTHGTGSTAGSRS